MEDYFIYQILMLALIIVGVLGVIFLKDEMKDKRINELEIILEQQQQEKEVYIHMLEEENEIFIK